MLPSSNNEASFRNNIPTRFYNTVSYIDFDPDDQNQINSSNKAEYVLNNPTSPQQPNRKRTDPSFSSSNSLSNTTSTSIKRDETTLHATSRDKPVGPCVTPIEEHSDIKNKNDEDDDLKQSGTESSPPTQTSVSPLHNDHIQPQSSIESSCVESSNQNPTKISAMYHRNDTYEHSKIQLGRRRSLSEKRLHINNTQRNNSDDLLSTLGTNDEAESPRTIKLGASTTKPSPTKLIPIIKSSSKTSSLLSRRPRAGHTSSIKHVKSLNTPRPLGLGPSIGHHNVQGVLVRFLRNGDAYHQGVQLGINEFELKSWEAFLKYLDRQPKLCLSTGGIKHIYTLDGEELSSIHQLHNRQSYVVASGAFIPTNYRYANEKFADETDVTSNVPQESSSYSNSRLSVHTRVRSPSNGRDQIFLLPYSKLTMYESILLNRHTTQRFEFWLENQVTDVLSHYTDQERIRHLFGVTQESFIEITSFSKLFSVSKRTDTFIACTEHEYFRAKQYLASITPDDIFTDRLKLRRTLIENRPRNFPKRSFELANLSINWMHGYNGENETMKRLYSLPNDEILYIIGSLCILYEPRSKEQRFYTKHTNSISCVHVHTHMPLVASSEISLSKRNQRALVHIWDPTTVRTIAEISKEQFGSSISLLSFSPSSDDALILIVSHDRPNIVSITDWKRSEIVYTIACDSDHLLSALFVFNKTEWIACISRRSLMFYHVNWNCRPLHVTERGESGVQNIYTGAAACGLVGQVLLVGDKVGNTHIWRLIDHEPKLVTVQEYVLENSVETIEPINQDVFLVANALNQIKIWNMNLNSIEHIRLNEIVGTIQSVCCIRKKLTPSGIAIGTKSNYIIFKELGKDQFDVIMRGHTKTPICMCYRQNSRFFYSISSDRNLFKWNVQTRTVEWAAKSMQPVSCADLHPERNIIVLGTETSKLVIYDTLSSYYITTITLKVNTSVKSIRFSPGGSDLAVGLQNGHVYIFNVLGNGDFHLRSDGILQNNNTPVEDVLWSSDSKYLLAIFANNNNQIWRLPSLESLNRINIQNIKWHRIIHPMISNLYDKSTMDPHTSIIMLSPNLALCCGKDGQLRLIQHQLELNKRQVQTFKLGLGPIQSIIPSSSNNTFLISVRDHPIIVEIQINLNSCFL